MKPYLDKAAQVYGIPTLLLSAQIEHESSWQPKARGYNKRGGQVLSVDRGIAQINDYWHPEISDEQADDPAWAVDWMARTMSEKMGRLGDWGKALSEYNTGDPQRGFANGYVQRVTSRAGVTIPQIQPASPTPMPGTRNAPAAMATTTQPQSQSPQQHTVQRGDTLWDIANRFLGSGARWRELQGYGGEPRKMPIGTQLTIPTAQQPQIPTTEQYAGRQGATLASRRGISKVV